MKKLLFLLLISGALFAQIGTSGTTAGSKVTNGTDTGIIGEPDMPGDIVIRYAQETGLGTLTDTATESVSCVVGQIFGLDLNDPGNKVASPGQVIWLEYRIANKGNALDTFRLSLGSPVYTGNYGGAWSFQIWNSARTAQISTITVAEDGEGIFYLRVGVHSDAENSATGAISVRGTTTSDGGAYTVGNFRYGGADDLSDWGTTTVSAAIMKFAKSLSYTQPAGYTGANQYVPGGTITYTITYWNEGAGTATNVLVSDRIPTHTEYGTGTLKMGDQNSTYNTATPKTDAVGDDQADYTNGLVRFNIGEVAPNVRGKLYFCVVIK